MSLASNEKVDMSAVAAAKIAEVKAAFEAGASLDDATVLEALLSLEKKCRLCNDPQSTRLTALTILGLVKEKKDWPRMNALLKLLSKRRSQMNMVISGIVTEGSTYLEPDAGLLPDDAAREALLVTLKDICDGKIYVEKERALLTRQLAVMKEAAGDVTAAADTLQEVHVETYGSLSKREKIDFIEEQIRLTLAKGDNVRAYILSKKVQRKFLIEDDYQDLKVRFYKLMIEYHTREKEPFELATDHHEIYSTKCVADDEAQWVAALSSTVLFLVLSPHTPGQSDMMHRLMTDEKLENEKLAPFHATLKLFTTKEIIAYPMPHQAELEAHESLHTKGDELFAKWRKDLHTRVVQHNVRVVAGYYKRIRAPRLAQLLGLTEDETERHVSALVTDGTLVAKIDRPAKIIQFTPPKPPEEALSDWAADISKLLTLVDNTCHLIGKEHMVHKVS